METGLEGKPWYLGAAIGLVLGVVAAVLLHLYAYQGKRDEIAAQERRISDLQRKVQEGQNAKRQLPQFREEVRRLELDLEKLLRILPARKNTPDLIRRIRTLTEQAGFDLRVFDPAERETDREFYKEWPINIDLQGDYHELALFFDRISRFSRIINIDNLQVTALNSSRHTIQARFTAKTFVYKEPEAAESP